MQKICNWTNDYHNQLNNKETDNKNLGNKNIRKHQIKWKDLTLDEVYDFILLQIYFGVVKIPDIRLCWSKNAYLNQKYVYEKKSRDRYRQISQYNRYSFCLNNSDKKENKYKDFLLNIILNSNKLYKPSNQKSIDESKVKFEGRAQNVV